MVRTFLIFLMLVTWFVTSLTADEDAGTLTPTEHQEKVSVVVATILGKYHYRKMQINDSVSSVIFDNYVKNMSKS